MWGRPAVHEYWYSAKHVWRGRSAIAWQGWTIDVGIAVLFIVAGPWFRSPRHPVLQLSVFFGVLFLRAAIARWKGEPDE